MKRFFQTVWRIFIFLFIILNVLAAFNAYKFTHFYDRDEAAIAQQKHLTGWAITKNIIFGVNAYKQKSSIVPDSTFQTVYLTTKDSIKLQAWYIPVANAKGTVCMFHGHGSSKSAIFQESIVFRQLGYNTLLLDFRAHGNSGGNTSTIGYYESEDVKLAYDFIKNKGEGHIVLWGISMGGAAIAKAISDYQLQPEKIILEMPYGSILKAAEGRIKMMKVPAEPLAVLITSWGGIEHGFWSFGMKPTEFVKTIKCPVLLQWGRHDPRVSQQETDEIYANITAPKKLVIYEASGHESLCEKEHDKWVNEVTAFLK